MMNAMRKNMKSILWVVVLAFVGTIFFVWGMDLGRQKEAIAQQSAAMVNDQPISHETFGRLWDQVYNQRVNQSREEISESELTRMRGELIQTLIDRSLQVQLFGRLGLKTFSDEVAAWIASMPVFQQDGKFSAERYLTLLNNNRIQPEAFEAEQREALVVLKTERLLGDSTVISEGELQNYFFSRSRALRLSWLGFAWKEYRDRAVITESQEKAYYENHRAELDQPEEVRASHILIGFKPNTSEEEKLTAKLKAENIKQEISKGLDFAEAAKKYSADPGSQSKGGDLGFFRKGMMVPPFEKAAFALPLHQVSDPVETNFGFHLIKVAEHRLEKKSTFEGSREKISAQLREEEAKKMARAAAEHFQALLKNSGSLAAAAKSDSRSLSTTDWLKEGQAVSGIAKSDRLVDAALDLPLHSPSGPIQLGETIYFVQPSEEKIQPFRAALYSLERDSLLEKLKTKRAALAVEDWLAQSRKSAKITNNIAKEAQENQAAPETIPATTKK